MVGYPCRNLSTIDQQFICSLCSLIVKSPLKLFGCDHRLCQSCFYENDQKSTIICRTCGKTTTRENVKIDPGHFNAMQTILIECSFCDWSGVLRDYQKHFDENHSISTCQFCQKQFSSIDDFIRHESNECPLVQIGCRERFRHCELHQHCLSGTHQMILSNFIRQYFHEVFSDDLRPILLGCETLFNQIQIVDTDIQRLTREQLYHENALNSLGKELIPVSKSVEEKQFAIEKCKATDESIANDLRSMQQMIDGFALTSFDGTFIWKISNIRQKIAETETNIQTSFYSPPFYSSRNGYKMCLRLYPTGDGNARGTHLSLFFVLMRSDYDGILKYPFCFKVIFCLWDQSGRNEHIIDSFRPDPRSNSFQRPRSEMNIASGLPKFVPLDVIRNDQNRFIRDETIFIKVVVDFGNLSQRYLEELFQLNPAVPNQMKEITEKNNNDLSTT